MGNIKILEDLPASVREFIYVIDYAIIENFVIFLIVIKFD